MRSVRNYISIFSRRAPRRPGAWALLLLLTGVLTQPATAGDAGTYLAPDAFVAQAFHANPPPARVLWMRAAVRDDVTRLLGRSPAPRVRYWQQGARTVWILDEVGKDQPITAGFIVDNGAIENVQVLAFRESRGWEVKYTFFTDQFRHTLLTPERTLNRKIDGITGATLSVRAMTRMARVALLLDAYARSDETILAAAR